MWLCYHHVLGEYAVPSFDIGTYAIEYFDMDIIQGLFPIPNWVPQLDVPLLELERDLRGTVVHRDLALTSYPIAGRIPEQYFGGTRRL